MKRKLVIALLALTLALLAAGPATATLWDVYYTFTAPVNPPGGAGWTEWIFPASVPIAPSTHIYIGAENVYNSQAYKVGTMDITYNPFGLYNLQFTGNWATGELFTSREIIASYDGYSTRLAFEIHPQPAWEWAEFVNIGTEPIYIQYMAIDTTCVPLPASLLLLGSGLAACGVWRRCRKTPI